MTTEEQEKRERYLARRREYTRRYRLKHRDEILQRQRNYRDKNRSEHNRASVEWYRANREKVCQRRRELYYSRHEESLKKLHQEYQKHREKRLLDSRRRYRKNREKILEENRAKRRLNPEFYRAKEREFYAKGWGRIRSQRECQRNYGEFAEVHQAYKELSSAISKMKGEHDEERNPC